MSKDAEPVGSQRPQSRAGAWGVPPAGQALVQREGAVAVLEAEEVGVRCAGQAERLHRRVACCRRHGYDGVAAVAV